jgi:hypothetical protein
LLKKKKNLYQFCNRLRHRLRQLRYPLNRRHRHLLQLENLEELQVRYMALQLIQQLH